MGPPSYVKGGIGLPYLVPHPLSLHHIPIPWQDDLVIVGQPFPQKWLSQK